MSVLRCAYGTRASATREGAERIDESCEFGIASVVFEMLLLDRFHNVPIIPTFGLARRATAAGRRQPADDATVRSRRRSGPNQSVARSRRPSYTAS